MPLPSRGLRLWDPVEVIATGERKIVVEIKEGPPAEYLAVQPIAGRSLQPDGSVKIEPSDSGTWFLHEHLRLIEE